MHSIRVLNRMGVGPGIWLTGAFCALLAAGSLHADTVALSSGKVLEGAVLSSNSSEVLIETETGKISIPKSSVTRIEYAAEPADPIAQGDVAFRSGRYSDAEAAYVSALRLQPEIAKRKLLELGRTMTEAIEHQLEDARPDQMQIRLRDLLARTDLHPSQTLEVKHRLGALLFKEAIQARQIMQPQLELKLLSESWDLHPAQPGLGVQFGRILLDGNRDQALKVLHRYCTMYPDDPAGFDLLASQISAEAPWEALELLFRNGSPHPKATSSTLALLPGVLKSCIESGPLPSDAPADRMTLYREYARLQPDADPSPVILLYLERKMGASAGIPSFADWQSAIQHLGLAVPPDRTAYTYAYHVQRSSPWSALEALMPGKKMLRGGQPMMDLLSDLLLACFDSDPYPPNAMLSREECYQLYLTLHPGADPTPLVRLNVEKGRDVLGSLLIYANWKVSRKDFLLALYAYEVAQAVCANDADRQKAHQLESRAAQSYCAAASEEIRLLLDTRQWDQAFAKSLVALRFFPENKTFRDLSREAAETTFCQQCRGAARIFCVACKGSGQQLREVPETCPDCRGKGVLEKVVKVREGLQTITDGCPTCGPGGTQKGSGQAMVRRVYRCDICQGERSIACKTCQGTGQIRSPYPRADVPTDKLMPEVPPWLMDFDKRVGAGAAAQTASASVAGSNHGNVRAVLRATPESPGR